MDSFSIMAIAIGVGAAVGALSAYLGWNKTGEPFDTKKFISGLVTGIVSGIALVLANQAGILNAVDNTALLVALTTTALAILGVDTIRTNVSGAITKQKTP